MGVNDGGHGVGGIVESVHKFKSKRGQQRYAQQDIRPGGQERRTAQVSRDAGTDENQATDKNQAKDQLARFAWLFR